MMCERIALLESRIEKRKHHKNESCGKKWGGTQLAESAAFPPENGLFFLPLAD
jgi:hypothetical protein